MRHIFSNHMSDNTTPTYPAVLSKKDSTAIFTKVEILIPTERGGESTHNMMIFFLFLIKNTIIYNEFNFQSEIYWSWFK